MSNYEIPSNVSELFANGERCYKIDDREQSGDNVFAMGLFVDCVGIPEDMIECDDGTQLTIFDGETRLQIDSGGLGDFHLHGYEVTVI